MPAIDDCQASVVNALKKEGWEVKDDPLYLNINNEITHLTQQGGQVAVDGECERQLGAPADKGWT